MISDFLTYNFSASRSVEKHFFVGVRLYYYGARYYDPQITRWSSVDPLAEKLYSSSPYVYVKNSPIIMIDPDGRFGYPTGKEDQYANDYKRLTKYLNENISEILASDRIMKNLEKYSWGKLTPDKVKQDIVFGNGPTVDIVSFDPPNQNGNTTPDGVIQLNVLDVLALENASPEDIQAALLVVVSSLLHEYTHQPTGNCHWNPWNPDGTPNENYEPVMWEGEDIGEGESGAKFEGDVYGMNISNIEEARSVIETKKGNNIYAPDLKDESVLPTLK